MFDQTNAYMRIIHEKTDMYQTQLITTSSELKHNVDIITTLSMLSYLHEEKKPLTLRLRNSVLAVVRSLEGKIEFVGS